MSAAIAAAEAQLQPEVGDGPNKLQGLQCGNCGVYDPNPNVRFFLCIGVILTTPYLARMKHKVLYPDMEGNFWRYTCMSCRTEELEGSQ